MLSVIDDPESEECSSESFLFNSERGIKLGVSREPNDPPRDVFTQHDSVFKAVS